MALRLVAALWRFWQLGGHLAEGHELVGAALSLPGAEAPTSWRLGALTAAGGIAYWHAEVEEAVRLYTEQLALATALGDVAAEADAHFNLLSAQFSTGHTAEAQVASREARRLFERLGDDRGVARADWGLATMFLATGQPAAALPILELLLDRFMALGDAMYHAITMGSFAWINFAMGRFHEARPWVVKSLGELHSLRDVASTTISLEASVVLALDTGRFDDAALLTGAFEGLCERYGVRPPAPLQSIINRQRPLERLGEAVPPDQLAALLERGRRMNVDEAVAHVIRMADQMDRDDLASAELVDGSA